jgi:hypothetical protein
MDTITLTFAGKPAATYQLAPLRSQCVVDEILGLATSEGSGLRANAAAIGVAAPRLAKQLGVAPYSNPVRFGGAMYDALRTAGVSRTELLAAGAIAVQYVMTQVITDREVTAAEDFSEQPGDNPG